MSDLPGVTIDAKDEEELAAAFGVTSNAEELVRQNAARRTTEHSAVLRTPINDQLTETLYEGSTKPEDGEPRQLRHDLLEDAIGHPVVDAVVRGKGRRAAISYVYQGPRGSFEKDYIPYGQVLGDEPRQDRRAAASKPEGILQDAEAKAREELADARDEISRLVTDAREEAAKLLAEAEEAAQKIRDKAAAEAVKAAEEEKDKPDAEAEAKSAAARSRGGRKASK